MEFDLLRISFAFFAGYFLCLSGSLSQLVTHNNLASPSTLGMDGVAVLVVLLAQFCVLLGFDLSLEFSAFFLFSLFFTFFLLTTFIRKKQEGNVWKTGFTKKIVLLGLSFNLFVGAIFSILWFLFMSMNIEFPSGLWFGNFKQYQAQWLYVFIPVFLLCLLVIWRLATKLDLLNIGENFARGLGINVQKIQKNGLMLALLLTGVVISFFGVFSFIGLIFPHLLRSLGIFRTNMKRELVFGPLFGGLILSIIDFACYTFTFMGAELPVGMVSGVIGSFALIFLVSTSKV